LVDTGIPVEKLHGHVLATPLYLFVRISSGVVRKRFVTAPSTLSGPT
jgi:hypothetical protein